ncbi:hypothetical protein ACGFWE_23025 [Streptomyces sp. NPDC048523]|uniref:hypothetical protein n=1 Tax=Streptomyces sp. NPDC048523 TaxID=3365567 RepID=UPI003716ABFF
MTDGVGTTKVRDVVRAVVTERAPNELPLVEGLFRFDDQEAVRVLAGRGPRREPLGFGLAEATALVTTVVWLTLDQVARRALDAAADGLLARCRSGLRRVLRRGAAAPPCTLPELDRAQLTLVRAQILRLATERGIDTDEAASLADAVVVHLATADPGADGASGSADTGGEVDRSVAGTDS